jgi:hypothetical protein
MMANSRCWRANWTAACWEASSESLSQRTWPALSNSRGGRLPCGSLGSLTVKQQVRLKTSKIILPHTEIYFGQNLDQLHHNVTLEMNQKQPYFRLKYLRQTVCSLKLFTVLVPLTSQNTQLQ